FRAEFTRPVHVVDPAPLVVRAVHGRLDPGPVRRLAGAQPRPRHGQPGAAAAGRVPGQHRQVGPYLRPVQGLLGGGPVGQGGGPFVAGGERVRVPVPAAAGGGGGGRGRNGRRRRPPAGRQLPSRGRALRRRRRAAAGTPASGSSAAAARRTGASSRPGSAPSAAARANASRCSSSSGGRRPLRRIVATAVMCAGTGAWRRPGTGAIRPWTALCGPQSSGAGRPGTGG